MACPAGYRVRVEYAVGASPAEGDWRLAGYLDEPGDLYTAPVPTGADVVVRAFAEATGLQPSGSSDEETDQAPETPGLLAVELLLDSQGLGVAVGTLTWTPNAFCGGLTIEWEVHDPDAEPSYPYTEDVDATDQVFELPDEVPSSQMLSVRVTCFEGFSSDVVTGAEGRQYELSSKNPARSLVTVDDLDFILPPATVEHAVLTLDGDLLPAWVTSLDLPGTLDVTGAATFDATVSVVSSAVPALGLLYVEQTGGTGTAVGYFASSSNGYTGTILQAVASRGDTAAYSLFSLANSAGTAFAVAGDRTATFGSTLTVAGTPFTLSAATAVIDLSSATGKKAIRAGGTTTLALEANSVYVGLGSLDIGNTEAPSAATLVGVRHTFAAATASRQGMLFDVHFSRTSGTSSSQLFRGLWASARLGAAHGGNLTHAVAVRAAFAVVGTDSGSSGTVTGMAAIFAATPFFNGLAPTNTYGLYIEDQTGATNNYAIWTNAGLVRFGGNVSPTANDGAALGTTALGWSDLDLASGGVIRWANALTLTHAASLLTLATGKLALAAPTTSYASLRLPHGSAPTVPQDGDMWTETDGLHVYIDGVEYTADLTAA